MKIPQKQALNFISSGKNGDFVHYKNNLLSCRLEVKDVEPREY